MKYELAHDTLARQIFEKASVDAKARRKTQALVARAVERYQERQVLLTQDDLDEIRPFEKTIDFKAEELLLIQNSKKAIRKATQRRNFIIISVILVLAIALGVAVFEGLRARDNEQKLEQEKDKLEIAYINLARL